MLKATVIWLASCGNAVEKRNQIVRAVTKYLKQCVWKCNFHFFVNKCLRCNVLSLVTKIFVTSGVYFKNAKYFNIQTYYFKEINVLNERLLMIFCSKSKALCKCHYHQIWACLRRKVCHHNLTLLTLSIYMYKRFRLLSLKCPFDKKLIFLSFFFSE